MKAPSARRGHSALEVLVALAVIGVLLALLLPAVQHARESARRTRCANNLRQVGIAAHHWTSTGQTLPHAGAPAAALPKGAVGWRVAFLPYLEEHALEQSYRKGEAWDSPANAALQPKMPALYGCPGTAAPRAGRSSYELTTSLLTSAGWQRMDLGKTTSTRLIGYELSDAHAPVWTIPTVDRSLLETLADARRVKEVLADNHAVGFHALFSGGHVRFLRADTDPKPLRDILSGWATAETVPDE